MSEVEKYWNSIAAKVGDTRKYNDLNPVEQQMLIQSINLLIQIINRQVQVAPEDAAFTFNF